MNNFGWAVKLDLAVIVALVGLAVTIFQCYGEWEKENRISVEKKAKENEEAAKRWAVVLQRITFILERLERIEVWISANSGFVNKHK